MWGFVLLEIFQRQEGLEVFAETVEFLQDGVFAGGRVSGLLGRRRAVGCLPGKQLPAAVFDGGKGAGSAEAVVCRCHASTVVRFLVLR